MKKNRATICFSALWVAACGAWCMSAEPVDWNRYAVEGREISGNHDASFGSRTPQVRVTVTGRSAEEAGRLVDASYRVYPTSVQWAEGETAEILMDLLQPRFVSAVIVVFSGKAEWDLAASRDGRTWWTVQPERWVNMGPAERPKGVEITAAANLAVVGRRLRIRATPVDGGLSLAEIFVFGDDAAAAHPVGSLFTSFAPPVAGEPTELRAVIRNFGHEPVKNAVAELRQLAPTEAVLGRIPLGDLPPHTARVALLPWTPTETEPHEIEIRASGEGWTEQAVRVETVPVVNRRLYFPYWSRVDYERRAYANVSTTNRDFWYYLEALRGHLFLRFVNATHAGDLGFDEYYSAWIKSIHGPLRDGISMVEWSVPHASACDALERVYREREGRFILAWLAGGPNAAYGKAFQHVDVALQELYINYSGHDRYREILDLNIDGARKHGLIDRWAIALGLRGGGHPSTFEEIEREVRYMRYRGPEMLGVAFYGYTSSLLDKQCDSLCYKYFIAPAVKLEEGWEVQQDTVRAVIRNTGGMNSRDVRVAAYDERETTLLGTATVPLLKAGEEQSVAVKLRVADPRPRLKVLPSPGYTELNPPVPVEVYPSRQVRGLPLKACWTPPGRQGEVGASDTIVLTDVLRGEERLTLADVKGRGAWKRGSFYVDDIATRDLVPGHYELAWLDGPAGQAKGRTRCEILNRAGAFGVSRVNGEPWAGDPQRITIGTGDTFEVSWDLRGSLLQNCGIYLSAPGDDLEMPRRDGSYAVARIPDLLSALVIDVAGKDPVRKGSFAWKADLELDDLYFWHRPKIGWLRIRGDVGGRALTRADICQTPGTWRLWMGADELPAFPVTPVVTVTVLPPADEHAPANIPVQAETTAAEIAEQGPTGLSVEVDAPKTMTTGDIVPVRVSVRRGGAPAETSVIEKVELFKAEGETAAPEYRPRLRLDEAANPDPSATRFTARFMINSPEPGGQHFAVRAVGGNSEAFATFKIEVSPKTVRVGEPVTVSVTSTLPTGVFDSFNYLYGNGVTRCTGVPDFGPVGDSGVRWIRNMGALGRQYAESVGNAGNADLTAPEFAAEIRLAPATEPGTTYYLVHVAYIRGSGHYRLISVRHEEQD